MSQLKKKQGKRGAELLERELLIHIAVVVYLERMIAKSLHKLSYQMNLQEALRDLGSLPCMYKVELEEKGGRRCNDA